MPIDPRWVDPDTSVPSRPPKGDHLLEGATLKGQEVTPRDATDAPEVKDDYSKLEERYKKRESEIGRQANEIGQLRAKLAELEASRTESPPDYYTEPEKAIESKLKPLQQKLGELEAEKLRAELRASHPDYQDVVAKPEFREWLQEKRSRMLLAISGESGDVDAAKELLDTYKASIEDGTERPQEAIRRDRMARAISSERGSGRKPTGKVYRREELQNLRAFEPRKYQEMLPEIRKAYVEGRVIE